MEIEEVLFVVRSLFYFFSIFDVPGRLVGRIDERCCIRKSLFFFYIYLTTLYNCILEKVDNSRKPATLFFTFQFMIIFIISVLSLCFPSRSISKINYITDILFLCIGLLITQGPYLNTLRFTAPFPPPVKGGGGGGKQWQGHCACASTAAVVVWH